MNKKFLSLKLKIMLIIFFVLIFLFGIFILWVWFSTYHPKQIENIKVYGSKNAPKLKKNSSIKVLSWNIQYLAGKNYVFFYDLPDGTGPDTRPSSEDIQTTLLETIKIIKEENPDVILLQEVDNHAKRTDYRNELKDILNLLPKSYKNYVSTYYWKASFVPHPKIMGKVGMKLVIISKYKLQNAKRYALPEIPNCWIMKQFNLKRAVLTADIPYQDGDNVIRIMNTHLSAFAQGSNTMQKQVDKLLNIINTAEKTNTPWILGGDFNLLPPNKTGYEYLGASQKKYYSPESEIKKLNTKFSSIPSEKETLEKDFKLWFTHFPNDPDVKSPDRTIDYIFYSKSIKIEKHYVRQKDTLKISDHFPIISIMKLK